LSEESEEEGPQAEGCPAWMATFGDMMSLLLCFFVLLLSFSEMNVVKFKRMLGSMDQAFGVSARTAGVNETLSGDLIELSNSRQQAPIASDESSPAIPPPMPSPEQREEEEKRKLDQELLEVVDKVIQERGLDDRVEAVLGDKGVTIRADSQLMFQAGQDRLKPEAAAIMEEVAELAALFPYKVLVEGHTDDSPIRTAQFPSNWELSAARAVAGVRHLIDVGKIDPSRIGAAGFADTQPIVSNDSDEGRAKNRRVEFVFYREDG